MRSLAAVVNELIEKLETEGVGGVYAWFVGRPHVAVYRRFDGYVVVLWRGPVRVEIHLDENYNVKAAYVRS